MKRAEEIVEILEAFDLTTVIETPASWPAAHITPWPAVAAPGRGSGPTERPRRPS